MIKNNKFNPQMCKKQPDRPNSQLFSCRTCAMAIHIYIYIYIYTRYLSNFSCNVSISFSFLEWGLFVRFRHIMFLCAA